MKCITWLPDPNLDDLVAVGVNSGRVDLIRLEAAKQAREDKLTMAFCAEDPNYLAVGLDKVRSDCSLVIWDITSIGPGRPHPSVPRGETNPRHDPRILQQYAPQEVVSCLTFLPKSNQFVLAGISYRWLRLFDLRSQAPNVLSVAGKIQALATDPFDQHRVAPIGDNVISVWDTRRLTSPLTFSERDAMADGAKLRHGTMFSAVELSSTRRGCLGTLEKDSTCSDEGDGESTYEVLLGCHIGLANRRSASSWGFEAEDVIYGILAPLLVLGNTRRTFPTALSSFAPTPEPGNPYLLSSNVLVVTENDVLEVYAICDAPKQAAWSALGNLAFGSGVNPKTILGLPNTDFDADIPHSSRYRLGGGSSEYRRGSRSRSARQREDPFMRGRAAKSMSLLSAHTPNAPLPLFGREDEGGLPPLLSVTPPVPTRQYTTNI